MCGNCIHCSLNCAGGDVVHSYGRLIPHEFPIVDLQQISGPDEIGRINCSISSGTAIFFPNGVWSETDGVSETRNGDTATLVVNTSNVDSFRNTGFFCTNIAANFFYLFISSASKHTCGYLQIKVVNCAHKLQSDIQVLLHIMRKAWSCPQFALSMSVYT